MNFQAVSVGQKLEKDNFDGSCADDTNVSPASLVDTPTAQALRRLFLPMRCKKQMRVLASMIAELKAQGIYDSTLFIVTSKHGQSPINPLKTNKPGHFADLVAALPDAPRIPRRSLW